MSLASERLTALIELVVFAASMSFTVILLVWNNFNEVD